MSLRIPDSLAFDIKEDIYLVPEEKSSTFSEVIEHPMGLRMLAYVFSEVTQNKEIEKIQRNLPDFLELTKEEFDEEVGNNDSFRFDEDEFKSYQKAFFKAIQNEAITTGMRELAKSFKSLKADDDKYSMTNVFGMDAQTIMDEMSIQFKDLEKNSKMNKLLTSQITREEDEETGKTKTKVELGIESTGGLMDAFDKGRPLLFTDIEDYIEVDDSNIVFDTTKYVNKLFATYNVDITEDTKQSGGERVQAGASESIPLFDIAVAAMTRSPDGGYKPEKITVQGFAGKKTYDSFSEFYDAFESIDLNALEAHIEDTLLTSKKSPLADVIYQFITPKDGKLDTGQLEIILEKNEKDEKKLMQSFVRQFGGISASNDKKVANIEVILQRFLDLFNAIEDYDNDILTEMYESNTDPKDISYMFEDMAEREEREEQEEAETATEVEDVVEPEGKKGDVDDEKQKLINELKGISPALAKLEAKYDIELDEKDIYQLWKDNISTEQLEDWINSQMKAPSKQIFVHDEEYRTPGMPDFDMSTAREIEVDYSAVGDITENVFTAKVEFTPERFIDVKDFEIKNPTGKTLTGKNTIGLRGKSGAKPDLAKKLLKLQMGYNRLKAMVEE